MFEKIKSLFKPVDAETKIYKNLIKDRVKVGEITIDEKKELDELKFNIQIFGTYDHMDSPEANESCSGIAKTFKKDMIDSTSRLLVKHGFDPEKFIIWSDGIITAKPDNYEEIKERATRRLKNAQHSMEERQLSTMRKYGFGSQ